MTTPMGDLPDWQTLVTPPVLAFGISDIQAGLTPVILQTGAPFRVWGMWVRMSLATVTVYVAAILEVVTQIVDSNGAVLLEVACHVTAANQSQHDSKAIAIPGYTPAAAAGPSYVISLKTGASAANVFYRGGGGIFYSQP